MLWPARFVLAARTIVISTSTTLQGRLKPQPPSIVHLRWSRGTAVPAPQSGTAENLKSLGPERVASPPRPVHLTSAYTSKTRTSSER